jgi:hypothetical protein
MFCIDFPPFYNTTKEQDKYRLSGEEIIAHAKPRRREEKRIYPQIVQIKQTRENQNACRKLRAEER